jgi:hypothetical protein
MSITVRDLIDFHVRHFGSEPTDYKWYEDEVAEAGQKSFEPCFETSVVRYPDGTIRRLTDDQVEFFRNYELRQVQKEQQAKNSTANRFETPLTASSQSTEETKPFTPISSDTNGDEDLYGMDMSQYIWKLESHMDARFLDICSRERVKDYYPVVPLRNGE